MCPWFLTWNRTRIFRFSADPFHATLQRTLSRMKIHEYQGKELFRQAGVPVLEGIVAKTPDEAVAAYDKLGGKIAVVKSQIHAGGRGKGTVKDNPDQKGVVVCKSAAEVRHAAEGLLGKTLVTIQTGPEGKTVNKVFVEAGCDIARELYLGIVLDRAAAKPVLMVSTEGGVEIEKVAEETPELIYKEHFDPADRIGSLSKFASFARNSASPEPLPKPPPNSCQPICRFFVDYDCSMTEINPLVITGDDKMIALDAKITFDNNACFVTRNCWNCATYPRKSRAKCEPAKRDSATSSWMATSDVWSTAPDWRCRRWTSSSTTAANRRTSWMSAAVPMPSKLPRHFAFCLSDPNCKGVLVNIFGGIARCTTIAAALIEASKTVGFTVPLVVRLEGTEVEEGRKMLADSDVDIINATDITDAAKKIVAAAR